MERNGKTTKYLSFSQSPSELKHLEELIAASGMKRNRYIRALLASQTPEKAKQLAQVRK